MPAKQVTKSQCIQSKANPGFYLLSPAAKAWDRCAVAFGKIVLITGAWRSYAVQHTIFLERYDRGNLAGRAGYTNDVRWWPASGSYWTRRQGEAAAAVPGTSNHGGGVAIDAKTRREAGDPAYSVAVIFAGWTDSDRTAFLKVAAEHGWKDTEGRLVSEHWHLTYYPEFDQHKGEPIGRIPGTPVPPQPKPGTPAFVRGRVKRVQGAVRATKDGRWGDDTEKRLHTLYRASRFGGSKFPNKVEFAQVVVGAVPDGRWGDDSAKKHTASVKRIQSVLGLKATGVYDAKLHSAIAELKRKAG